jgi:acetylornithine deacetylase/succinyl-diaminopimelate desuccinylase-like protein
VAFSARFSGAAKLATICHLQKQLAHQEFKQNSQTGQNVMSDIDPILTAADDGLDDSVDRLFELLRIPSISTDPAYDGQCRQAADWLVDELTALGFKASSRETGGKPMVVAHGGAPKDGSGAPHVLFYGHYDVQPADPLELWDTEPFEPRIATGARGKEIVARGASDDKGQLMTFIEACRAYKAAGRDLPVPITILLEGEEESGSGSLAPFLEANKDELTTDIALVCDTNMWNPETPAITTMLRGLLMEEVVITAASRDLHSGLYGGAARNPIRVLSRVIADLHDDVGRVTLPGFYDGVSPPPATLKAQWDGLGFEVSEFLGDIGLAIPAGETAYTALEQTWARPTCDVNGIIGGYTGEGTKTVIPSEASAKVSFRLVGQQDPVALRESFRTFVEDRIPRDCTVEFIGHGASPALTLPLDGPELNAARAALSDEFGKEAVMIGSGGSIPIVGKFRNILGLDSLMIGFALEDDQIHSPNEKYALSSYHHGIRSWVRIMDRLAQGS